MCMTAATLTIPDGMPPLFHFPQVWHIGTTVLAQKKPGSHAGSGLAVTLHPRSWRRIAKLAGPLFRFEKANGVFADMRACFHLPQLMQLVWEWARAGRFTHCGSRCITSHTTRARPKHGAASPLAKKGRPLPNTKHGGKMISALDTRGGWLCADRTNARGDDAYNAPARVRAGFCRVPVP
jgi:hypothetical protein